VNWVVKVPLNGVVSPVDILRALPANENEAVEPVAVFWRFSSDNPFGLEAVTNCGNMGVHVWPAIGGPVHPAVPELPAKIKLKSRVMSGLATAPVGLKISKLGVRKLWLIGCAIELSDFTKPASVTMPYGAKEPVEVGVAKKLP
jgi:hypothetical protein